jgi:hypothetical protein
MQHKIFGEFAASSFNMQRDARDVGKGAKGG